MNTCAGKSCAQRASFQAVNDAFNGLLLGRIPYYGREIDTSILRTVLTQTDEIPFLLSERELTSDPKPFSLFTGLDSSLKRSRGSLTNVLERLFENVTVSMLSEPALQ
jgi:hypothetical protein